MPVKLNFRTVAFCCRLCGYCDGSVGETRPDKDGSAAFF